MTDETQATEATEPTPSTEAQTATVEPEQKEEQKKLRQEVEIKDIGPCKKHIKVTVNREDIDERFTEHMGKLMKESHIPGFRPGKAPRKLVEAQFRKNLGAQVKQEIIMVSLSQLDSDHKITPLHQPDLDFEKLEIPKTGPFTYEFEVEVRPNFELPAYKGLTLKQWVKDFGEVEVEEAKRRYLAEFSQIVPKQGGAAEIGDVVVADVEIREGDRPVGRIGEQTFVVNKRLVFTDAIASKFGEQIKGVKAGQKRTVDLQLSSQAAGGLGGKAVQAIFNVKDVKTQRSPELTQEFLQETFGLDNVEQFDEAILHNLKRKLDRDNRRWATQQLLTHFGDAVKWDLPEELVLRQARMSLHRRIMEMRADGMTEPEIEKQVKLMQQDIVPTTAASLRETFVFQKIAEIEKIEINDDDIQGEIIRLAEQTGESPRSIRARLQKENMLESMALEMLERQALDVILKHAKIEEVPLDKEDEIAQVASVEAQAVEGEMKELPPAPPPLPSKPASE